MLPARHGQTSQWMPSTYETTRRVNPATARSSTPSLPSDAASEVSNAAPV
jgi:hypothetical protein